MPKIRLYKRAASESLHNTKVLAYLQELSLVSIKHPAMCSRGIPDREIYFPGGRPGLLELKRLGKKPTALQEKRIAELRALGYWASWSDNFARSKEIIDDWNAEAKRLAK